MLWFRNLQIYRLNPDHALSADSIASELAKRPFVPCGSMDMESCGWVPPARHAPEEFALTRQDAVLVSLKTEEKVLPAAVIKDELDVRVQHIEAEENRKVGRKEQKELKDRITDELLPRAFFRELFRLSRWQQRTQIDNEARIGELAEHLRHLAVVMRVELLGELRIALVRLELHAVGARHEVF